MKITEEEAGILLAALEALQFSRQRNPYTLALEPEEIDLYRKIAYSFPAIPLLLPRILFSPSQRCSYES